MAQKPTWGTRTRGQAITIVVGLVATVVFGTIGVAIAATGSNDQAANSQLGRIGGLMLVLALVSFMVAVYAFVSPGVEQALSTASTALTPLPPLWAVQQELAAHLGRPATPQEVTMVYGYLRDQKKAAQMDTALLGGALLIANHYLRH